MTYFKLSVNPSKELDLQPFSYIKAHYLFMIHENLSLLSSEILQCSRNSSFDCHFSFSYVESFPVVHLIPVIAFLSVSHSTFLSHLATCARHSLPLRPCWPLSHSPVAKRVLRAIRPLGVSSNLDYLPTHSNLSTGCPADPALGTTVTSDFTRPLTKDWDLAVGTTVSHDNNGAHFIVKESTDAPTISLSKYIFFGKVSAVVRAAPGAGIISSVILQSDDLDEIDIEWVGNQDKAVQTNFFGKGNTTTYDRGKTIAVSHPEEDWYEYTVDWTKESIKWYVNGTLIRTVNYGDDIALNGKNYPQTPMRVKIGNWVGCPSAQAASDPDTSGTCSWAGGPADWSNAPFTMLVKSVTVQDYGCASQYEYGDKSGSYQSIKSVGTCGDASTSPVSTQDAKTTTFSSSSPADTTTTTEATRSGPNHDKQTSGLNTATSLSSASASLSTSSGTGYSQYTPTSPANTYTYATSTDSAIPTSTGNFTAISTGSSNSYSSEAYTATGGTGTGSLPTTFASSTVNSVSTTSSSSGQTISPTIHPGAAMSLRSPRILDFSVLAFCLGVGYLVL